MDFNQIKLLYEQIFSISLEIENLINEKKFEDLPQTVSKRDKLTELLVQTSKNNTGLQDYPPELQELIKKLNAQESKNLTRLEAIREGLRKELEQTGKSSRLVSAYSQDIVGSNIVDVTE